MEKARLVAVVGLDGNTFKPHTGAKTSVLFVQKWDETLCPKQEDYNIMFATQKVSGKDNSGEKVYETEVIPAIDPEYKIWSEESINPETGKKEIVEHRKVVKEGRPEQVRLKLDRWGHPIVKHDLYNTDGLTQDGIAEAFIEFAKKEKLSFVQ